MLKEVDDYCSDYSVTQLFRTTSTLQYSHGKEQLSIFSYCLSNFEWLILNGNSGTYSMADVSHTEGCHLTYVKI
jgi:hypothetical protein